MVCFPIFNFCLSIVLNVVIIYKCMCLYYMHKSTLYGRSNTRMCIFIVGLVYDLYFIL